jgi:hypothetical protein
VLDRVPGYRGYRLKEERRDADRRVRDAVADAYALELARVERIGRDLATSRRLGEIGAVEGVSQAIRHVIDRVRTVSPGYGGVFGDRNVDGVALDQLRLFDESLLVGVDELQPLIERLEVAAATSQPLGPPATDIERAIEAQLARLNTRQEVIESGHAANRESVLAALQPLQAIAPPDLYAARPGDALSILGDDHLIDAAIAVEGQPLSFRLLRINREPEEWLMVNREPGKPLVRMHPVPAPARGTALAGTALQMETAGTGDGEVIGERGSGGLRPVRYAFLTDANDPDSFGLILDWEGERQAFAGQRVEPLDVEVFRRTETAG